MSSHNFETLAQISGYASVMTCTSCNDGILHINFMNTSIRMPKSIFKKFFKMLEEAKMQLDRADVLKRKKNADFQVNSEISSMNDFLNKFGFN